MSAYSKVGAYYFFHHFQQVRTFLENNKTKDNKFISLQPNKTKCKSEVSVKVTGSRKLENGLVVPGTFRGWALINFLGFQGGRLFEVGAYSNKYGICVPKG